MKHVLDSAKAPWVKAMMVVSADLSCHTPATQLGESDLIPMTESQIPLFPPPREIR